MDRIGAHFNKKILVSKLTNKKKFNQLLHKIEFKNANSIDMQIKENSQNQSTNQMNQLVI